jgi:hypothetical protein
MRLSSLTFIGSSAPTAGYYTPFSPPVPGRLSQGTLEDQVWFGLLGYTTINPNVVVISIGTAANTSAGVNISDDGTSIEVEDVAGSNGLPLTNYYTVNMGMNSVTGGGWTLTFNAETKDKKSGTWVFVKSTTEPPHR